MGSASRQALDASRRRLSELGGRIDLSTAEQLFTAARSIGGSLQLRTLLADASTEPEVKRRAVEAIFGSSFGEASLDLLSTAASQRWSSDEDLLAGVEELGIRAAAVSAPAGAALEAELFSFGTAVSSNAELELAVTSKLGDLDSKVQLVQRLLGAKVSPQTLAIVKQLVQQPRARRIGAQVRYAASIVADQSDLVVATVTSARPISPDQLARLRSGLSKSYGRELELNPVVDPSIIGGLRVQVGDDVIDGSIVSRLSELRLQLAGR